MDDQVSMSWRFEQFVEGSPVEVTCKVTTKDGGFVSYSSSVGQSANAEQVCAVVREVAARAVERARK